MIAAVAHAAPQVVGGLAHLAIAHPVTVIALTTLALLPTVSAGGHAYAKCFKHCMDAAGNKAIVAAPICAAACLVTLPF